MGRLQCLHQLREGALNTRKFVPNIGKQRVRPGEVALLAEAFQRAQRLSERFHSAEKAAANEFVSDARDLAARVTSNCLAETIQHWASFNQIEIDQLLQLIWLVMRAVRATTGVIGRRAARQVGSDLPAARAHA